MKKLAKISLLAVLLLSLLAIKAPAVLAQTPTPEYSIRFNRDFGYGGGSNVRGTFSLAISGDLEKVASVTYFIDDKALATVSETPFRFQFNTDDQGFGWHTMRAEVTTVDGRTISLSPIRYNFVSPEEEKTDMTKIFIPIGGVIVGAVLVSVLIQFLGRKKKPLDPDVPRDYGMLGGTICPKCGHPFPRSLLGINLLVGRLERCEACGKFSLTTRATTEEIYRAEQAERATEKAADNAAKVALKKDDTIQEMDDSKYIDSI
jgi:hypothetical protein